MHDDRAVEAREHGRPCRRRRRACGSTTGLPSSRGELELRLEEAPLRVARRAVAVVVEAGLPDRDRSSCASSSRSSPTRSASSVAGLVRVDAERGEDAFVRARRCSSAARHESMPVPTVTIRSTPARAPARSSADGRSAHASRCACVSITPRRRASTRGKSGAAGSMPSAATVTAWRDVLPGEVVRLSEGLEDRRATSRADTATSATATRGGRRRAS